MAQLSEVTHLQIKTAMEALSKAGFGNVQKLNQGVQLRIYFPDGYIDYWPTTYKWACPFDGAKGAGFSPLLQKLKELTSYDNIS